MRLKRNSYILTVKFSSSISDLEIRIFNYIGFSIRVGLKLVGKSLANEVAQ